MTTAVALSRPGKDTLIWGGLAVLAGICIAALPPAAAGGVLLVAVVTLVILVEPALGVVVMLGVAPLKTLISTEAPSLMPVDIGQISLTLVMLAWLIYRVTRARHAPLPRTPIVLPLAVIVLAFSLSIFNAASLTAWGTELLKWFEMLVLVVIVLDVSRHGRWQWIAFGAVLAAALQAVIGLYQFFGGAGAPHLWILDYRRFRAFGAFGQPNPFSAFMGLSLPLALGLCWGYAVASVSRWRSRRRAAANSLGIAVLYAALGGLLLAGLIASWGRGAWMGFGVAAPVLVFFAPRKRITGALLLAAACAVVIVLWLAGTVPATMQSRIDKTISEFTGLGDVRGASINNDNYAVIERLAHWQAAYGMAGAHPFIGVGLGNYEAAYPAYALPRWPNALGHAHNDYLNVLAETGLIGLSAYLSGWAVIVVWTLRALRHADPVRRGLALGLLGAWTHLAVHSFVDKLYVNNLFLTVGVMLGLLAVIYQDCCRAAEGGKNAIV